MSTITYKTTLKTTNQSGDIMILHPKTVASQVITNTSTNETLTTKLSAIEGSVTTAVSTANTYTDTQISNLLGADVPAALDTLKELANALNNDANFYTTITGLINGKADSNHNHDSVYIKKIGDTSLTANFGTTGSISAGTLTVTSSGTINGKNIATVSGTPTSGNIVIADGTNGIIKTSDYTIAKSVPSNANFNDTTYSAGTGLSLSGTTINHSNSISAGTASEGGSARTLNYSGSFNIPSITYDAQGHITSTGSTTITLPAVSHYTSYLYAGASTATANPTTAVNDPYLVLRENGTNKTIQLKGGSNVAISTVNGIVTISSTNTTYSAGTGLSLSGTTINHSNSVTSGTASEGGSARTLAFGGTFNVPSVTYDAQGHVTGKGSVTLTMPANPDTHYTSALFAAASTTATSQATTATTNAATYIILRENNTNRNNIKVTGSGGTTVSANSGTLTISSTAYSAGTGISISSGSISNTGVRSIATGGTNGTISVNTNGTSANVAVNGLAAAAYKAVDTSITSSNKTSTNLPTTAAVANYVDSQIGDIETILATLVTV